MIEWHIMVSNNILYIVSRDIYDGTLTWYLPKVVGGIIQLVKWEGPV